MRVPLSLSWMREMLVFADKPLVVTWRHESRRSLHTFHYYLGSMNSGLAAIDMKINLAIFS